GIDAVEIPGNAEVGTQAGLITSLEGPGMLRFWTARDRLSAAYPVWLDDVLILPQTPATLPAGEWREFVIPVSAGTHRLHVQAPPVGVLYLDTVSWTPLPPLTPEEG